MKSYKIYSGLNGGFGGATFDEIAKFDSYDEAMVYAWEKACEEYEGFAGLHGLRSLSDIMEEDGVDVEEAEDIYSEERESWLDYYAKEVNV